MSENIFSSCVRGSHPLVKGDTIRSDSLHSVLHTNLMPIKSLKIGTCKALATKVATSEVANFFKGEKLGTTI